MLPWENAYHSKSKSITAPTRSQLPSATKPPDQETPKNWGNKISVSEENHVRFSNTSNLSLEISGKVYTFLLTNDMLFMQS